MPYKVKHLKNDGYRVTNANTGELYAKHTKNPRALISAIEINKKKGERPLPVVMPMKEFKEEHNRLIKILQSGDRKALHAEAEKQKKELSKYK